MCILFFFVASTSICANLIDAQYAVNATKPSGTIVNIDNNTFYSNKRTCSWSIVTNIGSTIKVKVMNKKSSMYYPFGGYNFSH